MTRTPQEQAAQIDLEARISTLELVNSEMASRLARQSDSLGKIDTKAGILVGLAATAAQFLATRSYQHTLGTLAFGCYAAALVCGVLAFRVADYKDIDADKILDDNGRESKSKALMNLAGARAAIFTENRDKLNRKAAFWTASLCAIAAGLILSTVALVVHTDHHERITERGGGTGASAAPASSPAAAEAQ